MSGKYSSLPRSVTNRRTERINVLFKNNGPVPLRALWLNFKGATQQYAVVQPGRCHAQDTYSTHTWILEDDNGNIWATYNGPETMLTVEAPGKFAAAPLVAPGKCCDPQWDNYTSRGTASGFLIKCHTCVVERAVQTAAQIVNSMMQTADEGVVKRLRKHEAVIAIIGKNQATGDIPDFWQHRYSGEASRGYGGSKGKPTCCCAEENVLFLQCNTHKSESILMHEVAHSVMNIGFDDSMMNEVTRIYQQAMARGTYDAKAYCMKNREEYWAEMTQAWFEATVRKDVTSSLRTRQEILNREPDLAKLMLWVYGDSDWLYPDTAPGPLSGGQAPSHHMKRVPVQQLRRQLAGEGAAPGFLGGIAEGNSGVGASGGSGREPGLGGITQSLDGGGLQGQFMGKMKELKGFAKGFFS